MSSCSRSQTERVKTINFPALFKAAVRRSDHVILKLDIEGKEYDVLRAMMLDDTLRRVAEIYCEWHNQRMGMSRDEHYAFIETLRRHGLNVTGNSHYDEFVDVYRSGTARLKAVRHLYYHAYAIRRWLRRHLGV